MDQAFSKFTGGVAGFKNTFEEAVQAANAAKEELDRERAKLAEERVAFEHERARIAQVYAVKQGFDAYESVVEVFSDTNEQITLNVGGTLFATTATTLKNAPLPSLFTAMFSGRHVLKPDERGHFFIDRDARHFHDILNFLRDGHFNYPTDSTDFKHLLELRAEAEYFGLVKLLDAIDAFPYQLTTVTRATCIAREEGWCYEDGQDEIVFSVNHPVQLMGIGFCGTDGSFTAELEITEVDGSQDRNEICKLREAAITFVKTDSDVARLMLRPPVLLTKDKCYMLSATIKGTDSFCGEDCLDTVVADGIRVNFMQWESPNGTNELRGQFPELYIRALHPK